MTIFTKYINVEQKFAVYCIIELKTMSKLISVLNKIRILCNLKPLP